MLGLGWGGGESGSSSGQVAPTGCQCIPHPVLKGRGVVCGPGVPLRPTASCRPPGSSCTSPGRKAGWVCALRLRAADNVRSVRGPGRPSRGGTPRPAAPGARRASPPPRPHARQRAAWAWGAGGLPATWGAWGGLSGGEAEALSNSATATAGQAVAWQPARRRQGWRA